MTSINAKVLADSVAPGCPRLVTLEVTYPRFVHAELMTHRVFSRNSASSRAIPLEKMLNRVQEDPARPVVWASEKKGMQGGDEISEPDAAEDTWDLAAFSATRKARSLGRLGVHKSIANRLLEPFAWHTVVITSTAWANFFKLRLDTHAQPEIRVAAEKMREAFDSSTPRALKEGQWHAPLIQDDEHPDKDGGLSWSDAVAISSARCARISYLTHAGTRDHAEDLRLYVTLRLNGHSSPLEHVAQPYPGNVQRAVVISRPSGNTMMLTRPRYGNLIGWHQHRYDVEVDANYEAYS